MKNAKILIIDDEKSLRDLLAKRFEAEGFNVLTAKDGDEGVEIIRKSKPDLIICDMLMPKKDGFAVLDEVRKDKNCNKIPFIMLTAVQDMEKTKKAYENEADYYVPKPFDSSTLIKNVKILLNLSKSKL